MSDHPATGSGKTGRRYFSGFTPAILVSLLVCLLMPRVGFEDTLGWYRPEWVLLAFNACFFVGGGRVKFETFGSLSPGASKPATYGR
jgi:hypothetical protein